MCPMAFSSKTFVPATAFSDVSCKNGGGGGGGGRRRAQLGAAGAAGAKKPIFLYKQCSCGAVFCQP